MITIRDSTYVSVDTRLAINELQHSEGHIGPFCMLKVPLSMALRACEKEPSKQT